ncbi:unnamed protein product, partial [Scytosiphon promiscuus]
GIREARAENWKALQHLGLRALPLPLDQGNSSVFVRNVRQSRLESSVKQIRCSNCGSS